MTVIGKPKVELIGNDGNAFAILGRCNRAAKRAGWTSDSLARFQQDAMSGDYDHLLTVVLEHFEVDGVTASVEVDDDDYLDDLDDDDLVWDEDYQDYV